MIENDEKEFERPGNKRLGGGILRFKRREIYRDKPKFEREKPDSEENNDNIEEEDEKGSDKDEEDSQNENNREPGNYRMYERPKNRFNRGRREASDGEDSYE